MVKSMTGFGKADKQIENKKFTVEVKSLNSKGADISVRMPSIYRSKEIQLRKLITSTLERGKIDIYISFENLSAQSKVKINESVVSSYIDQLKKITEGAQIPSDEILSVAMRLPDTTSTSVENVDESEWDQVLEVVKEALADLTSFREDEGVSLRDDLLNNIAIIEKSREETLQYVDERIKTVRERIEENLSKITLAKGIDNDRFEQELVYYMEKFDINEEQIRLSQHCIYFREMLESDSAMGKKLGFIAQEIGREVNTMGSKANHKEIQRLVVNMKDALEKIKEQMLNIL